MAALYPTLTAKLLFPLTLVVSREDLANAHFVSTAWTRASKVLIHTAEVKPALRASHVYRLKALQGFAAETSAHRQAQDLHLIVPSQKRA